MPSFVELIIYKADSKIKTFECKRDRVMSGGYRYSQVLNPNLGMHGNENEAMMKMVIALQTSYVRTYIVIILLRYERDQYVLSSNTI